MQASEAVSSLVELALRDYETLRANGPMVRPTQGFEPNRLLESVPGMLSERVERLLGDTPIFRARVPENLPIAAVARAVAP
jgi:hypothetical protein